MTAEELTINYEEEGILKVKELKKELLTKGAWVTAMYLYQEWDPKTEAYGENKVSIRRYRKKADVYSQQSKFNISGKKQGLQVAGILQEWFPE